MKLRLVVLLVVVFGSVGLWFQTAGGAPKADTNSPSVSAVTAVAIPVTQSSAQYRSFPSNLSNSSAQQCSDGRLKCGDVCCGSSDQCCFNRSTGGHYCSAKCE